MQMKLILKKLPFVVFVLFAGVTCPPNFAAAQEDIASLPDSPSSLLPDSPTPVLADSPSSAYPDSPSAVPQAPSHGMNSASEREVSWRSLPKNFLQDQKAIWLFPTQLTRGRPWVPTLVVIGGTAAFIYADPHIMPHFQSPSQGLDNFNDVFDPLITTSEVIALPASLMLAGYIRHDSYEVGTALLAAEAYGDSAIVDLAIKAVTRRQRPSDIPVGGDFHNTFFNGGKSPFKGSSFPSGHATGAFSVATVVARRYSNHRWVPWAVYGMATAISFSRVSSMAHFPSDVFLGAAIGYTTARYQVLRPR
jgi:membrane-associated phospholipid phosphatase